MNKTKLKRRPPMLGKKHTEKTKKKIRERIIELYNNKEYVDKRHKNLKVAMNRSDVRKRNSISKLGLKNPVHKECVKDKIRQSVLKLFQDPTYREKHRRKIKTAVWLPENRKKYLEGYSQRKNTYKYKNTIPEIKIQEELKKRKIEFVTDKRVLKQYRVDLFIKPNIVIECDGCYYHACKKCGFTKYNQHVPNRDLRKTNKLEENGYRVIRFWEHEIHASSEKCVQHIIDCIVS